MTIGNGDIRIMRTTRGVNNGRELTRSVSSWRIVSKKPREAVSSKCNKGMDTSQKSQLGDLIESMRHIVINNRTSGVATGGEVALDSIQSCNVTMERRAEDGVAVRALLWGVPRWVIGWSLLLLMELGLSTLYLVS